MSHRQKPCPPRFALSGADYIPVDVTEALYDLAQLRIADPGHVIRRDTGEHLTPYALPQAQEALDTLAAHIERREAARRVKKTRRPRKKPQKTPAAKEDT